VKGLRKKSANLSDAQTYEPWVSKKKKRSKTKVYNKIEEENFPNLKRELPIEVKEANWSPNKYDQNRTSTCQMIVKTISTENKERILKTKREKSNKT
jgi:hypothetical protein